MRFGPVEQPLVPGAMTMVSVAGNAPVSFRVRFGIAGRDLYRNRAFFPTARFGSWYLIERAINSSASTGKGSAGPREGED